MFQGVRSEGELTMNTSGFFISDQVNLSYYTQPEEGDTVPLLVFEGKNVTELMTRKIASLN